MPAKIIAVLNQKGGVGKTTIAMQLAGTLANMGFRTMVVDADRQGSATRWAAASPDDRRFPAAICGLSAAGDKVHREVKKYIDDFDVIVVDCPPSVDSTVPSSALLVADLALVPIIPSPTDLWAAVGVRELLSNVSDINETLQARLVPNMCQPNTEVTREALDLLREFKIPITDTKLCLRTAHRQSAALGGTVHDLGTRAGEAINEVNNLTYEVMGLLKLTKKRRAAHA